MLVQTNDLFCVALHINYFNTRLKFQHGIIFSDPQGVQVKILILTVCMTVIVSLILLQGGYGCLLRHS